MKKDKKQKKIIKSEEVINELDDFFTLEDDNEETHSTLMHDGDNEVINIDDIIEETHTENSLDDTKQEVNGNIVVDIPDKKEISETDQKEADVESFIKDNVIDDEGIIESIDYFKSIYLAHPEINDSFVYFAMKFRYFLISENIHINNITQKKIGKFLRLYPNLDIVSISNFLKMPLN